jgi:hypothetical protein
MAAPECCFHCGITYTPQRKRRSNNTRSYCSKRCNTLQARAEGRASLASREHLLRKKYGVTPERYWEMHAAQNGGCAICGRTEPVGRCAAVDPMWLAVDHDHDTGEVRGLLCMHCNTALGAFDHDPDRMQHAMNYLSASCIDAI